MKFVALVCIPIRTIPPIVIVLLIVSHHVDSFGVRSSHLSREAIRRTTSGLLQLGPQQLGTFESLGLTPAHDNDVLNPRNVQLFDWTDREPINFQDGWDFQKELMAHHLERLLRLSEEQSIDQFDGFDSIVMLQHLPVYTLGTGSTPDFVLTDSVPVVRMDRGGEVTYHGPGQLVVYPVIDLRGYKQDIHWYMRALEEAILLALKRAGILNAVREDDVTGVWIDHRKVAALGIKAKRWITQHGLAINITSECLHNFQGIVPCGLEGREVTCVNDHLPQPISVKEFAEYMKGALQEILCIRLHEVKS